MAGPPSGAAAAHGCSIHVLLDTVVIRVLIHLTDSRRADPDATRISAPIWVDVSMGALRKRI